ncbi:hypothetical protein CWI42_081290 [Ordospora colligata]|uniref:DUF155 domain-containing protein n=1 Tax=Ordospora colligata OC4 TaxID=1354746 RepID=A0A0B2UJ74_9MICR|nr:uncharacterized protein M896_081290 [Ordospora colligata OC4]KHN69393.1 hypothetical protein M896_081290 [Ordospora colligata OC4]TBU14907.1 hypothetical protein CWI41_081280 [Ordospora colligata]TBU15038.1 hypothetical protein CWI40_081300 [Ordospora colligata]TBU18292.1 hypothetical protein CWI42_081290 [Ordospora colligata]
MSDYSKQKVYLTDINREPNTGGRKQARIELRLLKEACSLKIEPDVLPKEENVAPDTNLFCVTAYCTADNYDLKNLYKYLKKNSLCSKVSMYFGECLYTRMSFGGEGDEGLDCFFYEYGVVVCWGMDANQESMIVKLVSKHEENPYEASDIEVESFKYGITENPFIMNDIIYLNSENHFSKMVVSIAIAQSVKLDYFENLVDNTIEDVKEFPEEMEREGKVSKNRREILKMIGKLHRLRFNLNLGSNILDEPEFVWDYPAFSPLYETCKRYLDIKHRADLLNRRCDVINGILEILSENTNRSNVEKFEVVLIMIVLGNVLLIILLMALMYYIRLKW